MKDILKDFSECTTVHEVDLLQFEEHMKWARYTSKHLYTMSYAAVNIVHKWIDATVEVYRKVNIV